jgi:hypothetical protein
LIHFYKRLEMSVIGEDGLVVPRKLRNPCIESTANRDLNRQIKWNAKAGVNVLTKSELEKALDRQRRLQLEREREGEKEEDETPFDKALKQRAKRLEQLESGGCTDQSRDSSTSPEPVARRTHRFEPSPVRPIRQTDNQAAGSPKTWRSASPRHGSHNPGSRSKSPAGYSPPSTSYKTTITTTKMEKDLETRLRGIKIHQNGSEENLKILGSRQANNSSGTSRPINSCGSTSRPMHSCGNSSSGTSSKSSSPEPELLKVFAQLRTTHKDEHDYP